MEQKKTLWIIAGVGVFLLVVLGAALIFYKPNYQPAMTVTKNVPAEKASSNGNGWSNPPEFKQPGPDFPRPEFNEKTGPNKVNDMIVVADNATVVDINKNNDVKSTTTATPASQGTTIDLNELKKAYANESTNQPQQNINITVNIPEKESSVSPVVVTSDYYINTTTTSSADASKNSAPTVVQNKAPDKKNVTSVTPKQEPAKPAQKEKTNKAAASTTTTTSVSTTTSVKPNTQKTVTRFWVQVAAYTNKKTAENARSVLSENKIPSDIFTYQDNKNRLFYRVRVGPYTTKSEAEYWQSKILKIDDFKNSQSYVTSTTD